MSTEGRIDVGLSPGQEAAEANIVFEQSKRALHLDGTAKTQMDSTFGHNVSGASSRFSQKVFLRTISLGLSGTLARQHCVRCGHPPQSSHRYQAVDTNCPSCTSVVSRLRCSFLPCTQVKQSSSGSYSMFSMRLLLVIVGGLYEAHLAILLQV